MSLWSRPDRREEVNLRLVFPGEEYSRLQLAVLSSGCDFKVTPQPGDTVTIDYDFAIEYYGIVKAFEALLKLLDDPTVKVARFTDTGLGRGGEPLFVQLANAASAIQYRLARRETA